MAKGPAEIAVGFMLIGTIFNTTLYGIMITQTFLYFMKFPNDRRWIKIFVGVLFFADTMNSVFDVIYIYDTLIIHFNDVSALAQANWIFDTDPALTGVIAGAVQLFFAWRVQMLTKNKWLTGFIATFSIIGLFSGLGTAIAAGIVPHFIEFQRFKVIVIVWMLSAIFADTAITISLVWHLKDRKTGFAVTDDIVNKIMRLTIQTGMVTTMFALADLIAFLVDPSGLHLLFNFPLSKLYTNSLMSTLNARHATKTGAVSQTPSHPDTKDIILSPARPEVFVHVESHEMVDKPRQLIEDHFDDEQNHWDKKGKGADSAV